MQQHRGLTKMRELTNGPGKLCQALCIHRSHDGIDLVEHPQMWIEDIPQPKRFRIQRSPRIGIREGTELRYRYFIDTNHFVSGPAAGHTGPRQSLLPTPGDTFSCPRDSSLLR
jgi:DNA-3-methyladenine glycosylase